jgi:hypothetical protein
MKKVAHAFWHITRKKTTGILLQHLEIEAKVQPDINMVYVKSISYEPGSLIQG